MNKLERLPGSAVRWSALAGHVILVCWSLVEVGEERLVGEVIGLDGDLITAQVYEETSGMQPALRSLARVCLYRLNWDPVLIQSIYDGVQRPLPLIEEAMGSFISRGARFDPISREKRWKYDSR